MEGTDLEQRNSASALGWAKALAPAALGAAGLAVANRAVAGSAESKHPPIGEFIEVHGVRLHYLIRGEGPPIVLLHGNGTLIEDWIVSGVLDDLARTHRVIAFDRPGFGHSARPGKKAWSPEEQAEVIAEALRALGIEQAAMVGHSFSTQVVLALALDHPQLVSRIVLLSGYYFPTKRFDVAIFSGPAVPVAGDVLRHTLGPWISRALEPGVSRKSFAPAHVPQRWKTQFPMALVHRPSQLRAIGGDTSVMVQSAAALSERYHELTLPITIIAGDGDKIADPQRQSEQLHQALPHSRLIMLPGIGHMAHYLEPAQISAAIRESA